MKKIYAIIASQNTSNKIWLRAFASLTRCDRYVGRLPYELDELGMYELEYDDRKE